MNTELPRNTIYITVQKFAGRKIFCNTLYISAMPSFVKIIVNKTPAAHHGEVCKVSSSNGSSRSHNSRGFLYDITWRCKSHEE